jgi:uncharacterized membrane protein
VDLEVRQMLRHRPHRSAHTVLLHPALGWFALAALYLAGCVLNTMLAMSTSRMWPLVLSVALGVISGLCLAAAARRLRQ